MKKLYIKPQIETVSIDICQLVCDSLKFSGKTTTSGNVKTADVRERGYGGEVEEEPAYGDLW